MASVLLVLRSRANKDGTHPLIMQITKDRKKSTIHLGIHLKDTEWDKATRRVKKSHPNSARLNNLLLKKLAEANDNSLELQTTNDEVTSRAIKQKIKPSGGSTFFPQAKEYLENLKNSGKYNQHVPDGSRINNFQEFLKNQDIAFSDITVGLLEKFAIYLRSRHRVIKDKKQMSERSIVNHYVVIRSIFAHARKNGIIKKDQSPFGEEGIKIKFPDSTKAGISQEDVEALENTKLEDPRYDHARKLWLISFYFAGMRVSDVFRLKWSDFQNYRLHYSMGKNDKGGSLKIPDKAVEILKHYEQFKQGADDFVFPELKGADLNDEYSLNRTIGFKTSAIDKILRLYVAPAAGIEKRLTMHISRHTFGGMAGDAIPIQMLQKLYRHSNVTTTIGYQANFINQAADDALDAVINKRKIGNKL